MKKIISLIMNKLLDNIIGRIVACTATSTIIMSALYSWLISIENFLQIHSRIFFVLLVLGWSFSLIFGLKIYFSSKRKIINGISVDKKGECYCKNCGKLLEPTPQPNKSHLVFQCHKCQGIYRPFLDDAKTVSANDFAAIQKENPQTVLTRDAYQKWDSANCKKNEETMKRYGEMSSQVQK